MFDELDVWEARIERWIRAKTYEAKSDLDDLFGVSHNSPMIFATKARCYDERQQMAYGLRKYADGIRPLKHANYIVARTDQDVVPGVIGGWRARIVRLPIIESRSEKRPAAAYHLEQIGVPKAHAITTGRGSSVAVIDTGIDVMHEQLDGKVVAGYDFVVDRAGCTDDNGHGTHVAGLIAGETVGAAPGASLYAAKVLDADGRGNEATVGLGMDWAIDRMPNLINMSLGSPQPSPMEQALVEAALKAGITICAAAGNEGRGKSYPAAYEGVISVAAVDHHNEHAHFSNIDPTVDVSAPGVDIISSVPGGYAKLSGTSMASPLACGVTALIAATGCSGLESALESSSQELGPHEKYGAGLVRADVGVGALVHKIFNRQREQRNYDHR